MTCVSFADENLRSPDIIWRDRPRSLDISPQEAVHQSPTIDAGQNIGSMWNYLKIYLSFFLFFAGTNPHSLTSLPAQTHSNASADNRIWKRGLATLNPREHQSVDECISFLNKPKTSISRSRLILLSHA